MATENFNLLSPYEMAQVGENTGVYKASKPFSKALVSAINAGIFISIAFAFYITATTGGGELPWGINKLIGGLCFSLGLILVVVLGADLFTSTVLITVAKITGKVGWGPMMKNWLYVYAGNLLGALIFVALIFFGAQYLAADGMWGLNVLQTASHKLHHTFTEAVILGTLANLMVCLAVWMSYAGRSLIDKALIMVLPVAMFVASGFEHSLANMFMIPMGIVIENFASPEFWEFVKEVGVTPETFSHINVENFIFKNLIPVTIGNIIGGALFVGFMNWYLYIHGHKVH